MPFRPLLAGLALLLALSPVLAEVSPLKASFLVPLKETDQLLRTRQWEAAARRARQAGEEIVDLAGTGDSPAYTLAVVNVFRAIAEAELGHQEDAEWFWDSALNLFPDVAKTDLSPYGKKARELRQRTLRALDKEKIPEELKMRGKEGEREVFLGKENVERPRIVRRPQPEYPRALQLLGAEGWVIVASVIGEDGRPRQPVIVEAKGGGAGMRYVALDNLRQWRFEPAKRDGQPVAVNYVLTVNFKQGRR